MLRSVQEGQSSLIIGERHENGVKRGEKKRVTLWPHFRHRLVTDEGIGNFYKGERQKNTNARKNRTWLKSLS